VFVGWFIPPAGIVPGCGTLRPDFFAWSSFAFRRFYHLGVLEVEVIGLAGILLEIIQLAGCGVRLFPEGIGRQVRCVVAVPARSLVVEVFPLSLADREGQGNRLMKGELAYRLAAVPANRTGSRLTLSSAALSGRRAPTSAAQVAIKSVRQIVCAVRVPGWIRPGQRAIIGTR